MHVASVRTWEKSRNISSPVSHRTRHHWQNQILSETRAIHRYCCVSVSDLPSPHSQLYLSIATFFLSLSMQKKTKAGYTSILHSLSCLKLSDTSALPQILVFACKQFIANCRRRIIVAKVKEKPHQFVLLNMQKSNTPTTTRKRFARFIFMFTCCQSLQDLT